MFETLESRQFLSATPAAEAPPTATPAPATAVADAAPAQEVAEKKKGAATTKVTVGGVTGPVGALMNSLQAL